MERIQRIATHDGTIVAVRPGMVDVQIVATSACAACAAHAKCGFAESKNKTVSVPLTQSHNNAITQYSVGDPVLVRIDQSRGMLAVWIAHILPAILMLGAIVGLSAAGVAEGLVALVALGVLGLYILLLYLLRHHVEGRFTLTLEPLTNH